MVGVITLITALAETTTELLKKMPDYDQKLAENWKELHRIYLIEIHKPEEDFDADLLLNLKSEIELQNVQITKAAKNV